MGKPIEDRDMFIKTEMSSVKSHLLQCIKIVLKMYFCTSGVQGSSHFEGVIKIKEMQTKNSFIC